MSRGKYLLVDGHSIIFAWPDLRDAHSRDGALARDKLAAQLQAYQDYTGIRVVLVFDGKACVRGNRLGSKAALDAIQIFYSDGRRTADDLIERLCAKYGTTCELTVATADSLERQTAISFGANCISPAALRERLECCERDLQADIGRLRAKNL